MAPFGIKQPTEWVRAKTPGILFTLYTTEKWQGLFQSLQKAQWILNPWAACCQAGCGTSQQHWCLCGASTESPLTQQPALPGVPVLPEPCLERSCHQSAVKILQTSCSSLFEGTFPWCTGLKQQNCSQSLIPELPLCITIDPSLLLSQQDLQVPVLWSKVLLELDTHSLRWAKGLRYAYWQISF